MTKIDHSHLEDPSSIHRRQVRRQIIAPVFIPVALLILLLVILFGFSAVGSLSGQQINVVMSCLVTFCILFPMVILFLIFDAIMLTVMFGAGTLHRPLQKALIWLREYTKQGAQQSQYIAWRISQPVISLRVQGAKLKAIWTRPDDKPSQNTTGTDD